jgi:KaiC/GvpD/RAD55 family RecA-like ATPase
MKGKQLAPLKFVEVKLTLQPLKKGDYRLNPKVQYLDERGQDKVLQLKTLEIKVTDVILEDRVTSGTEELDSLLLGGIPQEYAVVLSGSPCDEREFLVKNFLKAGVEESISFYVTTEATDLEDLLNKPSFFLFLCNSKPKVEVPDLPNVFKLQGKTDLTNLGIALVKAQRNINQSVTKKRICVEILSDVLVKHRENTTREWISGLITNYGAKGFTILAIMDPSMHPSDQANAVINLFDGEINITQSDDPLDCKKSILVKKLRNQDYIKNPICLT